MNQYDAALVPGVHSTDETLPLESVEFEAPQVQTVSQDFEPEDTTAKVETKTKTMTGWDRVGLNIPLCSFEKTEAHARKVFDSLTDEDPRLLDMGSEFNSLSEAVRAFTGAASLLTEALEKVASKDKIKDTLQERVQSLGINKAKVSSKYKGTDSNLVSGDEAKRVFTILTGGMRRITLWNSGITLSVKNISLDILNKFLNEMNHRDYQYGREYGGYYYLYADLEITRYVIERLLPLIVCGSNYVDWKDTEKLFKAISVQDYQVIMWTLASMMYPDGSPLKFICSNPDCGHIHEERVDLSKMRLNNVSLINDEMIQHFNTTTKRYVTDEDLRNYRKISHLEKMIEFEYGDDEYSLRKYRLVLRQPSLSDHVELGSRYNNELVKQVKATDIDAVRQYISCNQFRCYAPWIKSVELTKILDGKPVVFTIENYDDNNNQIEENADTIQLILDEFQQNVYDFGDKIKDYILSTKISHIAFYYPECTECHTPIETGYGGFIPYDSVQAFFTLGLTKLIRATSKQK